MQLESPEHIGETFWFPTPEKPGNESNHTSGQRRNLKELRGLTELGTLDSNQLRGIKDWNQCPNGRIP